MPSKLNSEFNYRYQTLGDTPWAKIQNLQGFLEGRIRAVALEEVSHIKYDAKLAELEYLTETQAPKHEILKLRAEIVELDSHMVIVDEAYELNREEITILNQVLAELYEIAEPTRIPGYTDQQMFEVNAAAEFTANTLRAMQSEIVANGRPNPATVLHAMGNPHTLEAAVSAGLFPLDSIALLLATAPVFMTQTQKDRIAAVAEATYMAATQALAQSAVINEPQMLNSAE